MRYEIPPHRTDGALCPGSMAVTTMPEGCIAGRCAIRHNIPLADAAPSRLEVTYAVLTCLDYEGAGMSSDLNVDRVDVNAHWDADGRTILRLDVTHKDHTFHYTITVDGDL